MAWVLSLEEVGLLVLGWSLLARWRLEGCLYAASHSQGCWAASLAAFSTPLGTPDLLDMLAVSVDCFVCCACSSDVVLAEGVAGGTCERR